MNQENPSMTMDDIIAALSKLGASGPEETAEVCRTAANVLYTISEEGARTPEEALDIIHDYRLQAKQYTALQKKYEVSAKPLLKDGIWHCPDCNHRVVRNHSFCHRCGKKMGWR